MKLLSFLSLVLFSSVTLHAQTVPGLLWQKAYGSVSAEMGRTVRQLSDGNYLIVGHTGIDTPSGDVTAPYKGTGSGHSDIWLVKTDNKGNIIREKCFGGTLGEYAWDMQLTPDGGCIILGTTSSNDHDVSGSKGNTDIWVVKLDTGFNIKWQTCLGSALYDNAGSVILTADGGYMVIGSISVPNVPGNTDALVVKLRASGAVDWQKSFGGTKSESGNSIIQTANGDYIFCGSSASTDGGVGNKGVKDAWVAKMTGSGTLIWQKTYGGSKDDRAYKIIEQPGKGYAFIGTTQSDDGDIQFYRDSSDAFVATVDEDGNINWLKTYGGTGSDQLNDIIRDNTGNFICTGYTSSKEDIPGVKGFVDVWVLSVNADTGKLNWQRAFGSTNYDAGYSLIQTNDNALAIAANTTGADADATGSGYHPSPLADMWLLKLGDPLSITSTKINDNQLKIYPTVTTGIINVDLPAGYEQALSQVYDITGKPVNTEVSGKGLQRHILLPTTAAGTYLLRITNKNQISTHRFIYKP